VVRALEVLEISGRPFTATLPRYEAVYDVIQLGVQVPRAELDERIAARVAGMWRAGLVTEVRGLAAAGLREGRTASRALGYAQVLRYLDGQWSQEQAAAETVKATRRFVRRQESWFRRDPRVRWLPDGPDLAGRALATIESCGSPRATAPGTTS
jgi:tRNA dimethylallyltransferase